MPQVPIYLNQEEMKDFEEMCRVEACTKYALAKKLVLEAIKSFKGEKVDREDGKLERRNEKDSEGRAKTLTPFL